MRYLGLCWLALWLLCGCGETPAPSAPHCCKLLAFDDCCDSGFPPASDDAIIAGNNDGFCLQRLRYNLRDSLDPNHNGTITDGQIDAAVDQLELLCSGWAASCYNDLMASCTP